MKKNVFLAAALLALMAAVLPAQTDDSGGTPGLKFTLPKGGKGYSVEKGKVKAGAVVIPESYNNLPVTSIAKKAFSGSTITGITIPNSVTDIGDQAFKSCKNLTEITIPDSVTTMGKEVFDGCKSLANVTIGNSVTGIGEEAFEDCASLKSITIPDNVTSIGKQAFKGCKSLTGIIIPNGVTSIESGTFDGCASLASITIPSSVTSIKGNATFGGGVFDGCTSLKSITIPNSVTSIDERTFFGCKNLTAINIDAGNTSYSSEDGVWFNKNKTVLLGYPQGKTGVYTIPNSVTKIGARAFLGCEKLIGVTIPNSVNTIEMLAFGHCPSLTSITIPNSVNSFGSQIFTYCRNLTSITFQGPIIAERYKLGDIGLVGENSPFEGDLREKFLAGGPGTYITTAPIRSSTEWTKR